MDAFLLGNNTIFPHVLQQLGKSIRSGYQDRCIISSLPTYTGHLHIWLESYSEQSWYVSRPRLVFPLHSGGYPLRV